MLGTCRMLRTSRDARGSRSAQGYEDAARDAWGLQRAPRQGRMLGAGGAGRQSRMLGGYAWSSAVL